MAEVVVRTVFQFKRGLAEAWARNNPLLQAAEPGYELDTGKLKFGDGKSKWNDLPYFSEGGFSEDEVKAIVDKYLKAYEATLREQTEAIVKETLEGQTEEVIANKAAEAVQKYLEDNPIQVSTDTGFTQEGVAADAAAIGEKCIYVGDSAEVIFRAGDADLID